MIMKKLFIILSLPMILFSCEMTNQEPVISAYEHYDNCSIIHDDFIEMIACGKERRNNYCQSIDECSVSGNNFVKSGDILVKQVLANEITENEAQLRFLELMGKAIDDHNAWRLQESKRKAQAYRDLADSLQDLSDSMSPTYCNSTGSVFGNTVSSTTTCY